MVILNARISGGSGHGGHRADSLLVGLYLVKFVGFSCGSLEPVVLLDDKAVWLFARALWPLL
jgi:hypothetical protein